MLFHARFPNRLALVAAVAALFAATLYPQPAVLTFHNDNARTGQNVQETILTPANVNVNNFGQLFTIVVDGRVDAQTLYVPHLSIAGQGVHNALYVATEHDTIYAFDADTGALLKSVTLLATGETTSDTRNCSGQAFPEIGVTATPAIDLNLGPHGTIYVVGMSKDSAGNYHHRLHALDLTTLAEQFNGPKEVVATYPGTGSEPTFQPKQHKERAALLIANGQIYTSWSSHCDIPPYSSWIIGYDEATLEQKTVLNLVPNGPAVNGQDGGIWAAGSGPQADAAGNIYVPIGNGTFDTSLLGNGFPSKSNFGNAYVKMSPSGGTLAVTDYFTMFNTVSESNADTDLGSGGGLLLPPLQDSTGTLRDLAVVAGKDTNIYVMDRNNLGKFNPSADEVYQPMLGVLAGGAYASPAWFNGTLYYGALSNVLKAFTFQNGFFGTNPASQTSQTFGYPGTTPSISANGASNGIVWTLENNTNPGVLHAYDASNLAHELYNSNQAPNGADHLMGGNKFVTPTVVNGKVYVASNGGVTDPGVIGVFGLRAQPPPEILTTVSVTPNSGSGTAQTFAFTFSDSNGGADISIAQMDINAMLVANQACYFYYERASNSIYMGDDAGVWQGPLAIGTGSLQNSQCVVNAGASSATISGNNLTVSLALSFKPTFAGVKNIYMKANNATADSGWTTNGTWTVSAGGTPWYTGWTYRKAITVNHAQVSGASSLSGFPMLFSVTDPNLASTINGGGVGKSDAADVLFTASDGVTKLNHELESYNPVTGQVVAWVRIPSLSPGGDTTIYVYYGNASASDQRNSAGVWDSNYKAVYHMADKATNPTVTDSTGINPGTAKANTSSRTTSGEIDGALSFNGTSDFIGVPQNGRFNLHSGPFTIETWIKDDATAANLSTYHRIVSWFDGANNIQLGLGQDITATKRSFYLMNAPMSALPNVTSTGSAPTGLNHVVVSLDASGYHMYLNGALVNGGSLRSGAVTAFTGNSTSLYLGQRGDGTVTTFVNGVLDEVRVSNTARSSDWVLTEFRNQSSPSSFYSVGAASSSNVSVTVNTNPAGKGITVDGISYTAPQTFQWVAGSSHNLAVLSPQAGIGGTQYVYSNWSDGGTRSHAVTAPSSTATYTATFTTQYQLTTAAAPGGYGSITPASGWQNAGSIVSVKANVNSGFQFTGFSGDLTGSTNPQNLTMNAPHTVTANFSAATTGNGYAFSRVVTIAHAQVSNTDQANFPLLFKTTDPQLKTLAQGGHVNSANGYDIIFTSDAAGTLKLDHEIESFDGSSGSLVAWVRIPSLSHATDTVIYLFYGNPSIASSQENKAGVWDSNYKAVYHMADKAANPTVTDSTGINPGTAKANTSSRTTSGEIDGALSFNGTSDFIGVPQNGRFNLHSGPFTIETWIKDDATAANLSTYHRIVSWFDGANNIQLGLGQDITATKRSFYLMNAPMSALPNVTSTGSAPTGLNHVVVSLDASGYHMYLNGALVNGGSLRSGAVTAFTGNSTSLYLGQRGDGTVTTFVNGVLDEVRISNSARSPDWVLAQFRNQSSPNSFYGVGVEQSH